MASLFAAEKFERVVHLGAQAGVRHSLQEPARLHREQHRRHLNVLEGCRHHGVAHLVYASSSSVYGASTKLPYSVHEPAAHPVSLYAATKRANELMAHSYSSLFGLPTTGLRFFTVYGPWGRPDMALFLFARAILAGKPIEVFNHGHHQRDFTYIDDIVEGVVRVLDRVAQPDPNWDSDAPGSRQQPRAVSHLQHRQQSAHRAVALYRGARKVLGQKGGENHAADAARRRGGYLCRRARTHRGCRLQAFDADRGGSAQLRRLVSRLLSRSCRRPQRKPALGQATSVLRRPAMRRRSAPSRATARHDIRRRGAAGGADPRGADSDSCSPARHSPASGRGGASFERKRTRIRPRALAQRIGFGTIDTACQGLVTTWCRAVLDLASAPGASAARGEQ